jgi:hypothetical protein
MPDKVKSGDRIRILEDNLLGARVYEGDVLKVTGRHSGGVFIVESPRNQGANGWWISDSTEGRGWQRVEA